MALRRENVGDSVIRTPSNLACAFTSGSRFTGPALYTWQLLREGGYPELLAEYFARRVPSSWPWRGVA